MTINVNDIKIFQAQDNTDNDSGGGSRTSTEIVDGDINNLFPDISRIDTVSGDVGLRKIFPTVFTANRDIYYGAHSIIRKKPTDLKVSSLLFHSDDAHDKRIDAQNDIESYVVASYTEQFYLFGNHVTGSKTVTFLQNLTQEPPTIGEVYLLIDPSTVEQYIRISDMNLSDIVLSYNSGSAIIDYTRRRIICEIEQGLELDFVGSQFDPTGQEDNTTTTYATQVADAAKFYGTRPLAEDVLSGASALKVDTIYETLVPASKAQNPLVNQDAMSNAGSIISTGRVVNFSDSILSGSDYEIGVPIMPGTLTFGTWVDDGLGNLLEGVNVKGKIDYITGVISETVSSSGNQLVTFDLGMAAVLPIQFTGSILIDNTNQGLVFVKNMSPLPSPGNLYIDYRSRGKWYRISGNTDGSVGGSSLGSGNINDNNDGTGTLSLTLGSLPDIDSTIIISWGSSGIFSDRYEGVNTVYNMYLHKTLHENINPTSFVMVCENTFATVGTITADATGVLSDTIGNITGYIDLPTGNLFISHHDDEGFRWNDSSLATIDYDYANPGVSEDGEIKYTIITEGDFTSIDRTNNIYAFNIGTTVLPETVYFTIQIVYSAASFINGYHTFLKSATVHLVADASGNLVKNYSEDIRVWGTVSANGDVTLDLPTTNILVPSTHGDYLILGSVYTDELTQMKLANTPSIQIKYSSETPLTYPLSESLSDYLPNLLDRVMLLPEFLFGEIAWSMGSSINKLNSIYNYFSKDGVIKNRDSGLQVGVVDYDTGLVGLEYSNPMDWYLDVYSVATAELLEENQQSLTYTFKTSSTKIVPSSLQLRYYTSNLPGVLQTATTDANGVITGDSINVTNSYVDTETGMVHLEFDNVSFPDSIKYDAVSETTIPVDPDLLGLNPVRLPIDGRVPIYENGRHLVIFDEVTTATTNATPLANDVETLARLSQSYIEVIDANGKRLDPVQYIADRVAGTVTFGDPLTLEDKYAVALTAPFYIVDRVEDMLLAVEVQITGDMTLSAPLSHDYTAANSKVASALVWGDTGARVFNYFAQEIWNAGAPVWQDTLDGDPTTAQYDDINYPIQIDNQSSTSGRWAIIFTSSTTVQVAHEKLGIVAASFSISIEDVAPINPATGAPYFIMDRLGFGAGWVTNNVIRINTDSGDVNMWVIRTVQSGALSELTDNIEIEVRGDAN